MNLYIENKPFEHLLFLGDTHGENMSIAPHLLNKTKIPRTSRKAIVHVGDFGVGFCPSVDGELEQLYILNRRLMEHNVALFVIRGNHDNADWFNDPAYMNRMVNNEMIENIVFLPDHTLLTLELEGKEKPVKIYCNGGAISIDRTNRTQGRSYWRNEKFNCPSQEQLEEIPTDLDVIVTHNRPLGCHPTVYNASVMQWCLRDGQLDHDLKQEQIQMKRMFDSIRERNDSRNNIQHYFGHFHWNHRERIGDIAHITLAIKELTEFRYINKLVDQYNGKTRSGGLSPDTGPRA